ncbi:MAG: hypothetical protein IAI50_18730 [Candidatus Eremiobacteraeota bacterium]|nr:hypothetical protein [Candidatus Eremiobacteraeota bacterium]
MASACASIAAILQTHESAIETQATLEQTRIVSKQLGSSLWPYLAFTRSVSLTSISIGFANDGLGPALIRSFTISVDNRPVTRLSAVIDDIDPRPRQRGRRVGEADFGAGAVLRPSESVTIISISDKQLSDARAETVMNRARFNVCYCSLLDDCWWLESPDNEPHAVHACPHQRAPISM